MQMSLGSFDSSPPKSRSEGPHKLKMRQQQLVLLLHAQKCQQRNKGNSETRPCDLPHCSTMKGVLAHITHCQEGGECSFNHCVSSRQIIEHWKNCYMKDCGLCLPLRNIGNYKQEEHEMDGDGQQSHKCSEERAGQ